MRILIADQDRALAESIGLALAGVGMIPERCILGDGAEKEIGLYECDAMVVGDALPGIALNVFLTTLRRNKVDLPIVALVEGCSARMGALDAGADDALDMPFHPGELIARLQAVTRRRFGFASNIVDVGPLRVDFGRRRAAIDGFDVGLTPTEFVVLAVLVRRRGWVVSKPSMVSQMYRQGDEAEEKIVDVFVCKIRDKLAMRRPEIEFIQTIWGQGYCVAIGEPSARVEGAGVIDATPLTIEEGESR